ncbi:MAG: DUF2029 domain-containing protein [Candidatus Methanoplasma sp.]|nr:DUF2029 domain-containing protein [Candidatus Methanoplasma sp.]
MFVAERLLVGGPPTIDTVNVFGQAGMFKSGMIPYRDFVFEFPPLAMLIFLAPALFASGLSSYSYLYGLEMIGFALLAMCFSMKMADRLGLDKSIAGALFLLFVLAGQMIIGKFDIVAAAAVTASLYFCSKKRYGVAAALMTAGALIKIYPGALIPLIFVAIWFDSDASRRWRATAVALASCAAVALLAFVPLFLSSVSFGEATSFMGFHSDRGFQIESTVAVAIQALGQLGLTDFHLAYSHSTYDVVSPIADALLPYGMPACIALVAATLAFAAFNERRLRRAGSEGGIHMRMVLYSAMVMIAFMLSNKVFSTQYVVWLYPLLPIIVLAREGKMRIALAAVSLSAVFLSIMIFWVGHLSAAFPAVNIVRDAMLVILFAQALLMARAGVGAGSRDRRGQS